MVVRSLAQAECVCTLCQGMHAPPAVQGVHEIYDVVEGPEWRPGEARGSKLVFIGRRLRRDALAAGLHACLAPADS